MGESQNKFLNGLPNTACLPRRKRGFFMKTSYGTGVAHSLLTCNLPAKSWKSYQKTANNGLFWVLLFVE